MFTKEDYKEYFEQIASLERKMIYGLEDIFLSLDDEETRRTLNVVAADEKNHYVMVRHIFDSLLLENETEKRKFLREHSLGVVRIKSLSSGAAFDAYCVNISEGGLCVEFGGAVGTEGEFDLIIELFGKEELKHCVGKFVWRLDINPKLQIGKVEYKAGIEFKV